MKKRFRRWNKYRYKGMRMQYTSKANSLNTIKKIAGEHGATIQIIEANGMVYWYLDNRLDTADVNNFVNELGLNGVEVICTLVRRVSD